MFGLRQRLCNEISPALDTPAEPKKQEAYESIITAWMVRNGVSIARIALGLVFLWFGALKFLPGMSEAEDVARRTLVTLTFGRVPPQICLYLLAAWECAIGLGLLWGRFLRTTLILLFLQLLGTFLPLLFFPLETWKHIPYAPTLEGQYIIKNLVLVSAGIVIGSTVRAGRLSRIRMQHGLACKPRSSTADSASGFHKDTKVALFSSCRPASMMWA